MPAKTTKVFLDRIEGDMGVLIAADAGDEALDIPRSLLPDGIREGVSLTLTLAVDEESTASGKREVESLMEQLLNRNS